MLILLGIATLVYSLIVASNLYFTYRTLDMLTDSQNQGLSICQSEIINNVCTQEYISQVTSDLNIKQQEQFNSLKEILEGVRNLIEPILQLLLIAFIFLFLLNNAWTLFPKKIGDLKLEQNSIRSLIALIVVVTFAIAILLGSDVSSSLKDVVLVVIAFYFGSMQREKPASNAGSGDASSNNA